MELTRNHVQGEINMLYSYITKNLIGLQDVILKNVEQDENYIYIYVQLSHGFQIYTHPGAQPQSPLYIRISDNNIGIIFFAYSVREYSPLQRHQS